ncbi:S1 family peptidase [Corynebacterium pilosum]|uniref:Putative secreted protein n=1 Tax=Corynebacterium pilosum TaxID=35756 RepID=A0A376CNP7_9CORY|nr:S1 family peptidase [Corynebacterium pilosum]STC69892.1 putative secreted protein [Corynebacterium pilosum]
MQRRVRLRNFALSSATLVAVALVPPISTAQEAPPTSSVGNLPAVNVNIAPLNSAQIVDQVRADASAVGITLPQVDPSLTEAIDNSVNQFLPQQPVLNDDAPAPADPEPVQEPVQEPSEAQPALGVTQGPVLTNPNPIGLNAEEEPLPVTTNQNYWWRDDVVSKVMAAKPFADYVLHRVPGSWFDAPRIPEESNQVMTNGASLYGPGTPIYVGEDALCTLTMAGTDADGRKVGITAGHCGEVGEAVSSADSWQIGPSGTVVSKNEYLDYAVIEFGSNAEVTNTYNGATAYSVGGEPQPGEIVCKNGVATGETCGMTLVTAEDIQVNQVCAMVGDSGAPVFHRGRVVGMVNGGVLPRPYNMECNSPWQGALHAPTASTRMDAVVADLNAQGGVGAGFTLAG